MRHTFLITAFALIGCAEEPELVVGGEQPPSVVDFEGGFPPDGANLVDHSTDGGTWELGAVSAFGEGEQSAWLSQSTEQDEAGQAALAFEAIDLVGPATLSVDVAFPGRPFNSPQRLEIRVTTASGEAVESFDLDALSDVFLGGGNESYEPLPEDWFTVTMPLDPSGDADTAQITLVIIEDFGGLRPDIYVDNVAIEPR